MAEMKNDHEPWRDPIVAEVRRVREELFAAAGYDLQEFCRRLREEEATTGHEVVTRPRTKRRRPDDVA